MTGKFYLRLTALLLLFTHETICQQVTKPIPNIIFEKVYLHTDREHFWSGEDLWFKAYLLNGQTNMLSGSSNALVVELVNSESVTVAKERIYLKNGVGKGDFKLDSALQSGSYLLKAYTVLMSYFGSNLLFEKKIQISNPTLSSPLLEGATGNPGTASSPRKENATASYKSSVKFFPESGSMIEDVLGIVAFKTIQGGKVAAASGKIIDSSGKSILNFDSDSSGLGVFSFKPLPNVSYYARGKFRNGEIFDVAIPPALSKGVTLHAENKDSLLVLTVKTNEVFLNENLNQPFSIILRSKGKIYHTRKIALDRTEMLAEIKKSGLPSGLVEISLVDPSSKPHCERLIYLEAVRKPRLLVSTDKGKYAPKEKATVSIKVVDEGNKPVLANLSIAVIDADAVPENDINILSYLELRSELKGEIRSINQYFDESNPLRHKKLDLLLLTQGWRDFIWRRLLDKEMRVRKESNFEEISSINPVVLTSHPDRVIPLVANDSTTLKEVVIKRRQTVRLLDQSFRPIGRGEAFFVEPKDYDHKNLRHFLLHYSSTALTDNEFNVYFLGMGREIIYPRIVVDGVALPFTDDSNDAEIRNSYYQKYLNMPVSVFEKVEIKRGTDRSVSALTSPDPYGRIPIKDIVVMFLTTNGAISRNSLNALKDLENTFYASREFYAPDYESLNVRTDVRSTIHWEPNVITNDLGELQFSFFNSTLPHKIIVLVEGITENMGPVSGKAVYSVESR